MSRVKVFIIFLITVNSNAIPIDNNYSIINRELLLPNELFFENGQKLENQTEEVLPGLFEGGKFIQVNNFLNFNILFSIDIAMSNEAYKFYKLGLDWNKFANRKWPNRKIPYLISPLYDLDEFTTINSAIRTINQLSCLKFVPYNDRFNDCLIIWPVQQPYGCWSFIGRNSGLQILSLSKADGKGNNCLDGEGKALHELMHAAGIFHEQSRYDRDNYVEIIYDNIIPEYKSNFEKQSLQNTTFKFEYDYNSIMHYGWNHFAKNLSQPTIRSKGQFKYIGQRIGLSQLDCLKLNDLYGCLDDKQMARKYLMRCKALGLEN